MQAGARQVVGGTPTSDSGQLCSAANRAANCMGAAGQQQGRHAHLPHGRFSTWSARVCRSWVGEISTAHQRGGVRLGRVFAHAQEQRLAVLLQVGNKQYQHRTHPEPGALAVRRRDVRTPATRGMQASAAPKLLTPHRWCLAAALQPSATLFGSLCCHLLDLLQHLLLCHLR